ncbi:hypothetical protein CYMTET_2724 [Cymbomonas tetramitiformis]|uniref:Uncharacterized protein n=1 Tax=Cymbomonas tetramitiformis TaxID=36881 RepID=A0AAE0C1G2_9CHLO|nr:hypothetical protein CYMTET_44601 [Cymbomonas tetramitiformis]KAK3289865.1 hypothetical protein CYMTET_2724 [Cymbomonas tetramitiformis]|eukprot:gene30882-38709_t
MKELRKLVPSSTLFVSIIEANYGGWVQASRVAHLLADSVSIVHVSCDRKLENRRPGVFTTSEIKERMRHELQRLLREKRVVLLNETAANRPEDVTELVKQLKRCEYIYKPSMTAANVERRRVISGKFNGQNDDMAIAFMMLAYWSAHYINTSGKCAVKV